MSSLGRGLPSHLARGRAPREASGGVYTMFDAAQVKQFKEAFATIDQNGDGQVTESDLRVILSSLGTSIHDTDTY
jgi:myosin regulatory light chain 12